MDREKIISPLLSVLGVWLLLQLIILPFNYSLIPQIGVWFHWFALPLTEAIYKLLGGDIIPDPTLSDSISSYIWGILLLFISASAILLLRRTKYHISSSALQQILVLVLSFFSLRYGIDKVLGNQFFQPEPNTLHADIGSVSKDLLFWSSMGSSSVYNQFLGWSECIIGLLLLFKRTRNIALMGAAAIFLNVLFLNIGFNVTVKYLSGLLLLIALWLILSENHITSLNETKSWGSTILGIILLAELTTSSINLLPRSTSELTGTYEVRYSTIESIPIMGLIHIHSKGYLIVQVHDEFESQEIHISDDQFHFITNTSSKLTGKIKDGEMVFTNQHDTILAKRLQKEYPLLKDVTNWTVESYGN